MSGHRIYVASSWRNEERQQYAVRILKACGHEVYDFREPKEGERGFNWSEIDPEWQQWNAEQFIAALDHPIAKKGFALDLEALATAHACLLVMPCGRSAHLELGYCRGARMPTAIWLEDSYAEPELMYKLCELVTPDLAPVVQWAKKARQRWQQLVNLENTAEWNRAQERRERAAREAIRGERSKKG